MRNWLSLRRLVSPWAFKKCLPIAESLCSTIRWWRCRVVMIADAIWITQITCKRVNNALLIYDWRLDFSGFEVLFQFSADKYEFKCNANLVTEITHMPFNCVNSADVWSLKGKLTQTTLLSTLFFSLVPNEKLWMVLVMVELIIAKG